MQPVTTSDGRERLITPIQTRRQPLNHSQWPTSLPPPSSWPSARRPLIILPTETPAAGTCRTRERGRQHGQGDQAVGQLGHPTECHVRHSRRLPAAAASRGAAAGDPHRLHAESAQARHAHDDRRRLPGMAHQIKSSSRQSRATSRRRTNSRRRAFHDHFKPLPLEPVVPATAPRTAGYTPNPHKLESRTTTADAYQAYNRAAATGTLICRLPAVSVQV